MRVILAVLDSVGIGGAPDAAQFGDDGANTLGHIMEVCKSGAVSEQRPTPGPLNIPNMANMGLNAALAHSSGTPISDVAVSPKGTWAVAREIGLGKDTPSGHWEIAGFPVMTPPRVFKDPVASFPNELLDKIVKAANLPGCLGNKHSSGMPVVEEYAEEHRLSGKPIIYTSSDSVFQIATHEDHFGLSRLYDLCETARNICDDYNIGRVIARPFTGSEDDGYVRTGNRKDFTMPPSGKTLIDHLHEADCQVLAIGKIGDIFAHRGITETRKANGNMALFDTMLGALDDLEEGGLLFANFVDFDTLYGHARDPLGYARALEEFDARLPELMSRLRPDDVLILTADHGNDPTWTGTNHTREQVPVLITSERFAPASLGVINMADIGATIAELLAVEPTQSGTSFLHALGDRP